MFLHSERVEWEEDSMELANCTLELLSENTAWKQKTRILKAAHNFVSKAEIGSQQYGIMLR